MAHQSTVATEAAYELAEGPIWDAVAGRVRWVDIGKGRVMSGRIDRDRIVDIHQIELGQTTSAVAPSSDGGLLVAASRGLATVSHDGEVSFGPDLLGARTEVRLNDGSVDPQGRFIVGTLALGDETGHEVLLRVSPDGTVETLREKIRLSNGIGFSPDGVTIYHVDTFAKTLARHSYGPGAFDVAEPWVTVIDGFPHLPDGLAVDSDGNLWVAQFGGSRVLQYTPGGELLDEVAIDAPQATCPAFVGPALDILVITSGHEGRDRWTDRSGAIFLADVGVSGLPVTTWPGSTTAPYWKAATA
jgi:sugar lactone lactonase YvrE